MSYSEDLGIITVLVTHLGTCKLKSKSASKLAEDLSLEKKEIVRVLEQYPELFIVAGTSSQYVNEATYTLHLRYALRWTNRDDDGAEQRKPIEAEHLSALLSFIDNRVANELAASRQVVVNRVAVGAAIIAALSAIIAAVISSG